MCKPLKTQLQKHPTSQCIPNEYILNERNPKQHSLLIHTPLQPCELWKQLWRISLVTNSRGTVLSLEAPQEGCVYTTFQRTENNMLVIGDTLNSGNCRQRFCATWVKCKRGICAECLWQGGWGGEDQALLSDEKVSRFWGPGVFLSNELVGDHSITSRGLIRLGDRPQVTRKACYC